MTAQVVLKLNVLRCLYYEKHVRNLNINRVEVNKIKAYRVQFLKTIFKACAVFIIYKLQKRKSVFDNWVKSHNIILTNSDI